MERMCWLSNKEWSGSWEQSGNVLRLGRKRTGGGGEGGGRGGHDHDRWLDGLVYGSVEVDCKDAGVSPQSRCHPPPLPCLCQGRLLPLRSLGGLVSGLEF